MCGHLGGDAGVIMSVYEAEAERQIAAKDRRIAELATKDERHLGYIVLLETLGVEKDERIAELERALAALLDVAVVHLYEPEFADDIARARAVLEKKT